MPSGWNVYYIVFLAGALSLGVPILLAMFSYLVAPRGGQLPSALAPAPDPQSNPTAAGKRTNPRAFALLNSALVLLTLALLLLPCVVTLNTNPLIGLTCVLTCCLLGSLGLLYSIRKHDMEWLLSYSNGKKELARDAE